MTDLEVERVRDLLTARRDDMAGLLIELADLESPSLVPESKQIPVVDLEFVT